jgi:iron complex transport system substrate-binding protein
MNGLPDKPSVFTGVVYGDTWFMPGGNHYGARFFKDAGADYMWSNNKSNGILQLSFESVYDRARNADYWLGTATYDTFDDIINADARYAEFKAYSDRNIYNYTARVGPNGGNAYFESGYARPDIILKDLAKIFHPDQLGSHQFYYFKKLY